MKLAGIYWTTEYPAGRIKHHLPTEPSLGALMLCWREGCKRTGAQDGHWEKCEAHAAGGSGALPAEVVLGRGLKDGVGFPELERRRRGTRCYRPGCRVVVVAACDAQLTLPGA